MLHSYEAQLQGDHILWLGAPPPTQEQPRRVLVVLEDQTDISRNIGVADILQRARGALGHADRDAVLAELARSRDEWER